MSVDQSRPRGRQWGNHCFVVIDTSGLSMTFYTVILICPILLLPTRTIIWLMIKWNKLRCFCTECYVLEREFLNFEFFFEFYHDRNFLIRSQVDEIIAFLACEWSYVCSIIVHCLLHISRLPSALYCVWCLCCTCNLLYLVYTIFYNNNNNQVLALTIPDAP